MWVYILYYFLYYYFISVFYQFKKHTGIKEFMKFHIIEVTNGDSYWSYIQKIGCKIHCDICIETVVVWTKHNLQKALDEENGGRTFCMCFVCIKWIKYEKKNPTLYILTSHVSKFHFLQSEKLQNDRHLEICSS